MEITQEKYLKAVLSTENIDKLAKRYKKGFSEVDAIKRDLAQEREVLEKSE